MLPLASVGPNHRKHASRRDSTFRPVEDISIASMMPGVSDVDRSEMRRRALRGRSYESANEAHADREPTCVGSCSLVFVIQLDVVLELVLCEDVLQRAVAVLSEEVHVYRIAEARGI